MALVLLIGMTVPATMAYLTVKTEPIKNVFEPVKSPEHDFDIEVGGEKVLKGRDWAEGDNFMFILQQWDGKEWIAIGNDSVAYDKENVDFKKFDFSDIIKSKITEEGLYKFRIVEGEGQMEYVKYDDKKCRFDVTVAVADAETGALDVTFVENVENTKVSKDEQTGDYSVAVSFENTYNKPPEPPVPEDPDPVKINFEVDKKVKNIGDEEIGPKGFKFKLIKNSTKEEWTAEVDESGYAAFEMTYTKDDIGKVYLYELSEVNDGIEGVTYSEEVYDISVGIEVSEDNQLITTIKMDDKVVKDVKAKFENIYAGVEPSEPTDPSQPSDPSDSSEPSDPTKPIGPTDSSDKPANPPKDDGSKTGDDFNVIPVAAIMIAALAVMAVVVISGRRRKNC